MIQNKKKLPQKKNYQQKLDNLLKDKQPLK